MLLFVDSFDHYATADLLEKWTSFAVTSPTIVPAAGRHSSAALQGTNINQGVRRSVAATGAVAIVGMAYKVSALPPSVLEIISIVETGTIQVCLATEADGRLSAYRGSAGSGSGFLLGSTVTTLAAGTFAFIELKVLINNTVGTVDVRVNGLPAFAGGLPLTGKNTRATANSTWNSFNLEAAVGNSAVTWTIDDLYVSDGAGAAPWNDWLGDCRVDACYPTAPGATTGWTPSAGANWQCVDETAPNDDTDFTSATTAPAKDTYTVQDAPVVGAVVYGVQHCLSVKKMDAGAATLAPVIRHSGTDFVGTDLAPGTTYAYVTQITQTNPGTSAQWTSAGFNAAEFGYQKTS